MFRSSLAGQKWAIAKVIIAICTLAYAVYMIYCGVNYISLNTNQDIGREITPSDYGTLTIGEHITGTIDSVVCEYQSSADATGNMLNYYLVKSDNKMVTFKTQINSSCDNKMNSILNGSGETLHYKGYVSTLSEDDLPSLSIYAITNNLLAKNGMKGDFNDHIMSLEVSVTEYDDNSNIRAAVGAFVIAAFMLFLTFMFLKKFIKDFIYSLKLSRGKIVPEVKLTPDKPLENEKIFEGGTNDEGFFYVSYDEQENDKDNS
ncbi:MAG: hypothetical protein PUG48_02445 [Clostridia bacterium]|nr:hypothetical protein [Clostridia bacterium]